MKKFPKKLFVKIEDGGTGPEYFNPAEDVADLMEVGQKSKIAVYQLVEVGEAKGVVISNFKK